MPLIRKITKPIGWYSKKKIESDCCAATMPESDSVRANISAPMIDRPIETSYETICALERSAPSNAYFEFDDQPARIVASTPTLETASTKSTPMLTSVITPQSGPKGTTAKTMKAATTAMQGATKKTQL